MSLRWYGIASDSEIRTQLLDRLTLDVSPPSRTVVQIRGRWNRRATVEEMRVVRHRARVQGLRISDCA